MATKIGINGFGRIGRSFENDRLVVVGLGWFGLVWLVVWLSFWLFISFVPSFIVVFFFFSDRSIFFGSIPGMVFQAICDQNLLGTKLDVVGVVDMSLAHDLLRPTC